MSRRRRSTYGKKKRSMCIERKSTNDVRRKRSVCIRRPNGCVISMRRTRKRSICIWRRTSEGTKRLSSCFAWKRLWVGWMMQVWRML